jgi:putative DNA primase/helicase
MAFSSASAADIEAAFLEAARARGIIIKHLVSGGAMHRADVEGRGGRGDATYYLHLDSGIPNGGICNWKDGRGFQKWRPSGITIEPGELAEMKARTVRQARERAAQRIREQQQGQRRALEIIEASKPASPDHPYLRRKGVQPHGIRQDGEILLIPMRDAAGALWNVQRIFPQRIFFNKDKLFLRGRKQGLFFALGRGNSGLIAIAEGFATACSINEATQLPTAVAFDAGNLLAVAAAVRSIKPNAFLIFAADDDWLNDDNPGVRKATEAALAVGNAAVIIPRFGADRADGDTDFNDAAARYGLDAVREQFEHGLRGTSAAL